MDHLADIERMREAFALLRPDERLILTAALAGQFPPRLAEFRQPIITALAKADRDAGTLTRR